MKVLITREIPDVGIRLFEKYPQIQIDYRKGKPLSENELLKAIKDVDAIIPVIPDQINKKVIKSATNLKVIATYSVGYDHIDIGAATNNKIYVANTPGDLTESVAEHTFALMLAVAKRIVEADIYCRKGKYKYWEPLSFLSPKLFGKTVGIIGAGRIGEQFARMCKYGLNMKILYQDPKPKFEMESLLDAKKVELDELLDQSDVVSFHCNLCESTMHMIGVSELKKMKPTAYILNTARGKMIDEKALANALEKGYISGAGLDVFENEPEIYSKLLTLPNVVLTPHIASATREARIEMAMMAAQNVLDVLIYKKPPTHLVNGILAESVTSLTN